MIGRLIFVFVILVVAYAVARSVHDPILVVNVGYNDIPLRCIEHSITRVSCANVSSDDALLPHPDDCELFYYCVNAISEPICRQCPASLHFNPEKHVCDLPVFAGCRFSTYPPDEITTEPATTPVYTEA